MGLVYGGIAWVLGIWLARLAWSAGIWGCAPWSTTLLAAGLVLPAAGLAYSRSRPRWRLPAVLLLLLLLGCLRYQLHPFEPCFDSADLASYNGTVEQPVWATVVGTVVRPPEDLGTRLRVRLHVEQVAGDMGALAGLDPSADPADGPVFHSVRGDALLTLDRHPELRYGDRVQVRGRLEAPPVFEGFDYRAYLARQGVHTMIQRPEVRVLEREGGSLFWRALYGLRARGQQVIGRLLPEPEAALLTGILLGVETGIDRDLYDQFNKTGVSHIIVISGSNISVIAGVMTALFGRLLGKRRAFFVVVLGILFYTVLVGADGSVTRAAIMGILYAWAAYLGRQSTAIVSLFAAAFLMTLINPLTLWDVGFQLSFMATLSLMLFTPGMTGRFEAFLERVLRAAGGLVGGKNERVSSADVSGVRYEERRQENAHRDSVEGNRYAAQLRGLLMGFLNDALVVTLAAQVLTLPLVAYYFGRVSLVSPLANLLVLPVQPPIMIWGGLAVIVGLISDLLQSAALPGLLTSDLLHSGPAPSGPFGPPGCCATALRDLLTSAPLTSDPLSSVSLTLWPAARLLALVPWLALHWTVLVVKALAPLPMAALNVDLSPAALVGLYGLLGAGMLSGRPSLPLFGPLLQGLRQGLTGSLSVTGATVLLLVVGSLQLAAFRSLPDGQLHVHFLDVGRGEAILIETPDGQQVLIDGGYGPTELLSVLGEHMPFYDRQIELVVLTHPGDERIGGLAGLPERYKIGQVLQAPFPYPSTGYESWLRTLQEQEVPIAAAEAGMRVELGYGIALDVLHPGPEPLLQQDGELDLGANSLVLRLSYGETSVLLTGDAPADVQKQLVESGVELESTVVKVPDGGRQVSFSEAFLMATRPDHAVAFVQAEDRFRDLSAVVEEAWTAVVGSEYFHRTDLTGEVGFVSDGQALLRFTN